MRVLLAYDGSAGADQAIGLLTALRLPPGSCIELAAVLEERGTLLRAAGALLPLEVAASEERALIAAVEERLAAAAHGLRGSATSVGSRILRGRPADALMARAADGGFDLLVAGSRGHGTLETLLLGSVSCELADHAPCPVLVARGASANRVLVATDGSDSAAHAAATLADWRLFTGAETRVVAVAPRSSASGSTAIAFYPDWAGLVIEADEATRRERRTAAQEAAGLLSEAGMKADFEVRVGDAASEIVAAADAHRADVVVLGSRGLSTLPRLVLGSVARKVLLRTGASVLVVRPHLTPVREREWVAASVLTALA